MRVSQLLCIPVLGMLFLGSCGGGSAPQEELNTTNDTLANERAEHTLNIFHNIPSPMEMADLLKKAGADYDGGILNNVERVDDYTSSSQQALNLGIYGADLSYASVYNNTQESILYTTCVQKLAKKLDVSNAFSQEVVDRLETNRNNRDSLLAIISETYWDVDGYLKENERDHLSALMATGGWVEGLYIATQVANKHNTPELRQRIAEQRFPLDDLVKLLELYREGNDAISEVYNDLNGLKAEFAEVSVPSGESTMEEEDGIPVIGGTAPPASLTDQQFGAITSTVAGIRAKYIN